MLPIRPNHYANIMLDLETASLKSNAAFIELGAVYFDIDSLKTAINLQSCLDVGLVQDNDALNWVKREMPEKLTFSNSCYRQVEGRLDLLFKFVWKAVVDTSERLMDGASGRYRYTECEPKVWGNGAIADNV